MSELRVTSLAHDLDQRRSIVSFVWSDDPQKRLALFIPFGCSLENAREEAEKAVRELATELAAIRVAD